MSKQRHYVLLINLLCVAFAFTSLISLSQAQEETPTETPPEEVFVEPSPVEVPADTPPEISPSIEAPSATPIEQLTLEPTGEPTIAETESPVSEATPTVLETPVSEQTAAVTEEVAPAPGETPTLPLPAEPPLSLLFADSFDSGALDLWTLGAGWSLVPNEGGQALQVVNSADALTFVHGDLFNVAVQARFFIGGGSARLTVRQSSAGPYSLSLGAEGLVELYRGGGLVQSVSVPPVAGQWHTLRLSVMDGVLRVAVDGVEVIAAQDTAPLPPGTVLIAGSADGTLLVDDVSVWVPATEFSAPTAESWIEAPQAQIALEAVPLARCDPDAAITRASIAPDGTETGASSSFISISFDGRYVLFESSTFDPETGTVELLGRFYHDRQTCQTTALPDYPRGLPAAYFPGITSADGRYVVYQLYSGRDLVIEDVTRRIDDILLYDRDADQSMVITRGFDGSVSHDTSWNPTISADGQLITFESLAITLVNDDNGRCMGEDLFLINCPDGFLYDASTQQNTLILRSSGGDREYNNHIVHGVHISSSGRYVLFEMPSHDCPDFLTCNNVFVYDLQTGQTALVSATADGSPADNYSVYSSISQDGRFVAFASSATNLVAGDTNGVQDIFVRDLQTGELTRISVSSHGAQVYGASSSTSISAGGRYIVFLSEATTLVSGDTNGSTDVFAHDHVTHQTIRLSEDPNGVQANRPSGAHFAISADGRYVAFDSDATNLVSGDANGHRDVFVIRLSFPSAPPPPPESNPLLVLNTNDSGEGSLRAAIEYANTNPGADTITFNIAGSDPHTIRPLTALPVITDTVTIDGSSQPGANCNTWPPTLMIELSGVGLVIDANNSIVRGLVINQAPGPGIRLNSNGNSVNCNYIGTDVTGTVALGNNGAGISVNSFKGYNTIGSSAPGEGNLISGNTDPGIMLLQGSHDTQILGNYIGTNATGSAALANRSGIYTFDVFNVTIGGTSPEARNTISGNVYYGIDMNLDDPGEAPNPGGITIVGNHIGTDATGTFSVPNGTGISSFFVPGVTIGGSTPDARNIISGNYGLGIGAYGPGQPVEGSPQAPAIIQGNFIGTDITGTRPIGNGRGVTTSNGVITRDNLISANFTDGVTISAGPGDSTDTLTHNIIGADVTGLNPLGNHWDGVVVYASGEGFGVNFVTDNIIAFNDGIGVNVAGQVPGQINFNLTTEIRSNRIFANGGLEIDINSDGVTGNDYHDLDGGLYGLQNFPNLTEAVAGSTVVTGRLESLSGGSYSIQVFANDTCDLHGYGEGQILIGETVVSIPDSTYNVVFSVPVSALQVGQYLTATATSGWGGGGTSEFSACVPVQVARGPLAPVLRYPLANGTVSAARPSFSWNAVTGANRYHLQVASDPAFTTLLTDVGVDITAAAPVVLPQGTYFWRVQARNAAGIWGAYSVVRSFSVSIQRLPANNTNTTDTTPTFQWYAYSGARRYLLQVGSSDFSYLIIDQVVSASNTSFTPTSPLSFTLWYWRVSVDTGQGFELSPFSWALLVRPNSPPAPVLVSPSANAVLNNFSLDFTWNAVSGDVVYQIQIDNNADFSSPEQDMMVGSTQYTAEALVDGVYFWRVRAWAVLDVPGQWSAGRRLVVRSG